MLQILSFFSNNGVCQKQHLDFHSILNQFDLSVQHENKKTNQKIRYTSSVLLILDCIYKLVLLSKKLGATTNSCVPEEACSVDMESIRSGVSRFHHHE
jgi:hypothetical protein